MEDEHVAAKALPLALPDLRLHAVHKIAARTLRGIAFVVAIVLRVHVRVERGLRDVPDGLRHDAVAPFARRRVDLDLLAKLLPDAPLGRPPERRPATRGGERKNTQLNTQ